jgi:L-2-hydroxyglutarate oxidase
VPKVRYVVVGGGILGLATARSILEREPDADLTLVEKESGFAEHQTGRNSGVIHSGIYYPPGSAKARMCAAGARSMLSFVEDHGIPFQRTGKLIVATRPDELERLDALYQRGLANGVNVRRIGPDEAREIEPGVSCVGALHAADTAITSFGAVSEALAAGLRQHGARLMVSTRVEALTPMQSKTIVSTTSGDFVADAVVNCAGLYSDRLAAMDGVETDVRIVPFRGEYFELRPDRRHLVRGLIYPVPNPAFPFLGVHLTRMVDGSVHAGPNAVLALAREGYSWGVVRPSEAWSALGFPGFWRLARRHGGEGAREVARSLSKHRFAASLARLVPELRPEDLVRCKAGVRAQALRRNGNLVDDFLIERRGRNVHVLNAPSPAATSSLEIGRHVASLVLAD